MLSHPFSFRVKCPLVFGINCFMTAVKKSRLHQPSEINDERQGAAKRSQPEEEATAEQPQQKSPVTIRSPPTAIKWKLVPIDLSPIRVWDRPARWINQAAPRTVTRGTQTECGPPSPEPTTPTRRPITPGRNLRLGRRITNRKRRLLRELFGDSPSARQSQTR